MRKGAEIARRLLILKSMKCLLSCSYKMLSRCLQWSLLVLCAMGIVSTEVNAQPESGAASSTPEQQAAEERPAYLVEFGNAVKAYREGDYIQARKILHPLHGKQPENSRMTYYLAITEAQLGRFQQAKKLYQEILALDPNSEAAQ